MKAEFEKLKPFIVEFKPDQNPLILPSERYPNPIDTMPTDTRPCLHCGQINEHKSYMGSVANHIEHSIDFVIFNLGFTCTSCGEENHHDDTIVIEYTCSCCGGFTLEEDRHISEGQLRWYNRLIEEHGCVYFDVNKFHEGKCIADYKDSAIEGSQNNGSQEV